MILIELKWLLLLLILLPLLSIALAAGLLHWVDERRQVRSVLHTILPLLEHAPLGIAIFLPKQEFPYLNSHLRRTFGAEFKDLPPETRALLMHRAEDESAEQTTPERYYTVESDAAFAANQSKRRIRWWFTGWEGVNIVFVLDKATQQQMEQRFNLLLGRLSHELRTPLETILTHLEVLKLTAVSDEQKQQSIAFAKSETQRLVQLSNRALELVGIENRSRIDTQLVDLTPLVEGAISQLKHKAQEKQIDIHLQADTPLPAVVGNVEQLKQVFANLLNNSIVHGRSGDQVLISLTRGEVGVVCTIRDTGPGIDARHLPHLTEPFYRVISAARQSTGLGLAIVSEILQQHQSHLLIESTSVSEALPGEQSGTRVGFVLPIPSTSQSLVEESQ